MLTEGLHEVPAGKVAMVVTHLEMHAAPKTQDVALPAGVTFRKVIPTVHWYRDIFDRVGADWRWFGRRKLSDEALTTILNDPLVIIFTLSKNGQDEALLELDFRQNGECELAYFGLTSALIGTGAGRYLMTQAIRQAWERTITRLHVHTCTIDSPQALEFYIRSGFLPYKRQIEIADDPRLLGLLDREKARHVPVIESG